MKRLALLPGLALVSGLCAAGVSNVLGTGADPVQEQNPEFTERQALRPVPLDGSNRNGGNGGREHSPRPFDDMRWAEKLTDLDFDAREKAYDDLVRIARRSAEARSTIQRWQDAGGELGWTARLIQREVLRRPVLRFRKLESGPGAKIQLGIPGLENRLRSMEELFGLLNHKFEHSLVEAPAPGMFTPVPKGGLDRTQQTQLSMEPGKVVLHLKRIENGIPATQEFTAESIEALFAAHPELRRVLRFIPGKGWQPQQATTLLGQLEEIPTDVLGIEFLKGSDGRETGLLVERTVPGTIAQILGIQRGDRLIEINGTPLESGESISRILRQREACDAIEVTLLDSRGSMRTLTWRTSEGASH